MSATMVSSNNSSGGGADDGGAGAAARGKKRRAADDDGAAAAAKSQSGGDGEGKAKAAAAPKVLGVNQMTGLRRIAKQHLPPGQRVGQQAMIAVHDLTRLTLERIAADSAVAATHVKRKRMTANDVKVSVGNLLPAAMRDMALAAIDAAVDEYKAATAKVGSSE